MKSRFLIDAYFDLPYIYLMFRSGEVGVGEVSFKMNGTILKHFKKYNKPDDLDLENIQVGYFVKLDEELLFVNSNCALWISLDAGVKVLPLKEEH